MPAAAADPAAEDSAGLHDTTARPLLIASRRGAAALPADAFPAPEGLVPIRAVQYDERVRILAVEFTDGACYHFLDVPEPIYLGLVSAPSVTSYFRDHVAGRYAFRQME